MIFNIIISINITYFKILNIEYELSSTINCYDDINQRNLLVTILNINYCWYIIDILYIILFNTDFFS